MRVRAVNSTYAMRVDRRVMWVWRVCHVPCVSGHVSCVRCYVRHAVFTLSHQAEFDSMGALRVVCIPSLNAGFGDFNERHGNGNNSMDTR